MHPPTIVVVIHTGTGTVNVRHLQQILLALALCFLLELVPSMMTTLRDFVNLLVGVDTYTAWAYQLQLPLLLCSLLELVPSMLLPPGVLSNLLVGASPCTAGPASDCCHCCVPYWNWYRQC